RRRIYQQGRPSGALFCRGADDIESRNLARRIGMALKRPRWKPGTVVTLEYASSVLRNNPLGDPHVRKLALWPPPQYDAGAGRGRGRRFPVLFDLVGFTGWGLAQVAWQRLCDNVHERD